MTNFMSGRRSRLLTRAAGSALALALIGATAHAEQARSFQIPAEPLSQALLQYSEQANLDIVAPADLTRGKTAHAVNGSMTPTAALNRLLEGTGLKVVQGANGGLVLARADSGPFVQGDDTATSVGEVLVTAQKRNEPLKQVPGSVTVLGADTLANAGATELRDLNGLVPGLQVTGSVGSGEIVIRGVTTGSDVGSTSALVLDGVVVGPEDETGVGNGFSPQFDPAIISRIEVLKGPQGTLYGGSSLGGLVMYETIKPALTTPYGGAYAEVSDTQHGGGNYILRGNFSAPIVQDRLGFSLSANYADLSGFIKAPLRGDQRYDTHRNVGIRGALLWQVNPDLRVQVSDYYSRQNSFTDIVVLTPSTPLSSLTYNASIPPLYNTKFNMFALNADYDLHWATLSYVGSHQNGTGNQMISLENTSSDAIYRGFLPLFGGVPVPAGDVLGLPKEAKFNKYTSELKLASPDAGRFRWLVGAYYVNETDTLDESVGSLDPTTLSPKPGPVGDLQSFFLTSKLTQLAGFGDITYYVMPNLDVTAGVRVGQYRESYVQASAGADFDAYNLLGLLFGFTPTPALTPEGKETATVETYQASVRYHLSPDNMVYFRFATGYRPGGPNDIVFGSPPTFGPDTTDNFEIGWKTTFWDSRAYFEAALYDIQWKDIQVLASQNGIGYLTNGGKAEIKGAEAALTLRPVQGLSLNGTLSYTDGKLTEDAAGGIGAAGDTVPNTPKFSGSISASYTRPIANDMDGFLGGSARYVGERNTAFEHTALSVNKVLPAYTIVDLRAGVRKGPYEISAFARNVGDSRAVLGGVDTGVTLLAVTRPRTFGVAVSAKF